MRFSVVLCSLICSTSLALTIAKRDGSALAPREPVVEVAHIVEIEARKEKDEATKTKKIKATKPAVTLTPTYVADCAASERLYQGDGCGVYGAVLNPRDSYLLADTDFSSCSNACICQFNRVDCKAFAFSAFNDGTSMGNCTLYDKSLSNMGYQGGSALLYDRKCYRKSTPTSSTSAIHTMGAYETKVRRRAHLDDMVVGALAA